MTTVELFKNPDLKWDGETHYRADARPVEKPIDWDFSSESHDSTATPPSSFHKEGDSPETHAFEIKHSYIKGATTYKQWVNLDKGFWYVSVIFESQVDIENVGDAYWQLEIQVGPDKWQSTEISLDAEKGDQSFCWMVHSNIKDRARVRISYVTRWGSTNGPVVLKKLSMVNTVPSVPRKGDTLIVGKAVIPQVHRPVPDEPPHLPEESHIGDMATQPVDSDSFDKIDNNTALAIAGVLSAFALFLARISDACAELSSHLAESASDLAGIDIKG